MNDFFQEFLNSYCLVRGIDEIFKTKPIITLNKQDWEFLKKNVKPIIAKGLKDINGEKVE